MVDLLYRIIYWVAQVHDQILNINNSGGYYFDDKQLHFIVIGVIGMLMIFVTHPLFTLLARTGHTMVISWLYVFTLVLVLTFAIEIGQWFSGTGQPDMDDMSSGVAGFLVMFLIFAVIRGIFLGIVRLFSGDGREEEEERLAQQRALKKKVDEERRNKSFTGFFREKKAAAGKIAREGIDVIEEMTTKEEKTAEIPELAAYGKGAPTLLPEENNGVMDKAAASLADMNNKVKDKVAAPLLDMKNWVTAAATGSSEGSGDFDIIDELERQAEEGSPVQDEIIDIIPETPPAAPFVTEVMDAPVPDERVTTVMDAPEPDERMTFVMPAEELIDADPGDMDDMDDTADFEDFVGKHFSEQKPDIEEKQSTISEREVYKG